MKSLVLLFLFSLTSGCSSAHSDTAVSIEMHVAPDGSRCYVAVQDGQARGVSCR